MDPEREKRRLTTILSADVAGYSRLMAAEYRGRTVKPMGDGTLMEFGSVVDAVLFAVEVQRAMPARNEGVPKDLQIVYRIGERVSFP